MSFRIRYKPDPDFTNVLVSVKDFKVTDDISYNVHLHLNSNAWEVVNVTTDHVVSEGSTTSLHSMKIAAKAALEVLGVTFTQEERKKEVSSTIDISTQLVTNSDD